MQSSIDKTIHSIDYFDHDFDDYIEEESKYYLESFNYKGETFYFKGYPEYIVKFLQIINVSVEIDEGVEDPEVLNLKKLTDNELYLNYRFNLRRVSITLEILLEEYYKYKDEIEIHYYNIEFTDDTVFITILTRPYFDVSFIYNIENEYPKDFIVDMVYFG
ncbi:MAG: hypothetical protein FAF03_03660 [Epsilonproteobacteria bacterium]|nr:hypothetical protein [Campylobacterota bacterium]